MREKTIEKKLADAVKGRGGLAPKFTSPGFDGMPDRIVLLPGWCYVKKKYKLNITNFLLLVYSFN